MLQTISSIRLHVDLFTCDKILSYCTLQPAPPSSLRKDCDESSIKVTKLAQALLTGNSPYTTISSPRKAIARVNLLSTKDRETVKVQLPFQKDYGLPMLTQRRDYTARAQ